MADYYSVIARAVSRLPSKTDKARHAIYERARTVLHENLRTHDPSLSPPELATEQFALEAAISRLESELRRGARGETTTLSPSALSFISRVKEFVRWAREKLDLNISIIRNRLGSGKTTKVVPTKAEITERLAQGLAFVQITQLKAKNVGRRIASLNWKENWKETTVLIVLILAALVAGYFWPSDRASENAAQEKKQQVTENEHERIAAAKQRTRCEYEQLEPWSTESASQIEISDSSLTRFGNYDYNISAVVKNNSESEVTGLLLSITARDCPTQDAQVADCDIFGRVETFESDIPAGEVRQINGKITMRGVENPRYVVSPKFVVNGVRAPSDDALANRHLSGRLGLGRLRSGRLRCK
jgi:hypothetical protein